MSQVFGDPKRLVNDYMAGSHAIGITDRGIFPIWYDLPHDEAIMSLLDGLNMDYTR